MITSYKAKELIETFTTIEQAIEYADLIHIKSDLGYWREVKRRIVVESNRRKLYNFE